MTSEQQIQLLGAFVHGVLAAFHGLGLVYNVQRGNRMDTVIHLCALSYDSWAMRKHWRAV